MLSGNETLPRRTAYACASGKFQDNNRATSNCPISLVGLPNELILDICARFDSQRHLNTLLRTCRLFYELLNPLLYQYAIKHCCAETSRWAGAHGAVGTLKKLMLASDSDAIVNEAETTPLFAAAEHGKEAMMRFLIEKGIDLSLRVTVNREKYNAIHVAAFHGHASVISQLLDAGVEVDAPSGYDCTPMVIAASEGHDDAVLLLLERGANIAAMDGWERSTLCNAAGHCSLSTLQTVIDRVPPGALPELLDEMDQDGRTPLGYAVECKNFEAMKLLLKNGADLHGPNRECTPLRLAIEYCEDHVIQFLLDLGACPNESQNPRQYAPLPLAATLGHDSAVRMLLEKGADINYILPWGEAPLIMAAWQGHYDVVKRLLDAGTRIDSRPNVDALESALRHGKGEIALLLLERGADRSTCSHEGPVTLLSLGVRNDDRELVDLLLEEGVDLEAPNMFHDTALTIAAMNGRTEMARTLVKKGASIQAQDVWGRTPLAVACERGWLSIVLTLLDDGHSPHPDSSTTCVSRSQSHQTTEACCSSCDDVPSWSTRAIDTADNDGRTPLFYATVNGHAHVVAALLERGSAAMDLATCAGRTARSVAEQWVRDPTLSKRSVVVAINAMFDKSQEATAATYMVEEVVEEGRIASSPFFYEHEDWDLRQKFAGEFICHQCLALMNDYGEHFFCRVCRYDKYDETDEDNYTLCPECVAEGAVCRDGSHVLQRSGKAVE